MSCAVEWFVYDTGLSHWCCHVHEFNKWFFVKQWYRTLFFSRCVFHCANTTAFCISYTWLVGLPDAFCKNTGHFDLSTVPDLSCVLIRKRQRENGETISTVQKQLIMCPYFGWLITIRCVCDVTIAPRIASKAANKLRWKKCPDKIHY